MKKKLKAGIIGATGMVGQRFITLLAGHPWFEVVCVAASPSSAGKSYQDAVAGRWKLSSALPDGVKDLVVRSVEDDLERIAGEADFVFCALDMDKEKIRELEVRYAAAGIPVVSNNSAHRWTVDVPMIMPEINPDHAALIDIQRKNRGWERGLVAVKPNCSIQSYVPVLTALQEFEPRVVDVVSMQAISGAGKTFETWPEMVDNVIPLIGGEEEKSEREPMKIWGEIKDGKVLPASSPIISATCVRVSASDGHMASVGVNFGKKPSRDDILSAIRDYRNPIASLDLPSAPKQFIKYFEEENRPQTRLDRDFENGMGITMGRLRPDKVFDWKFVCLSHNTIRGAAGGAILMAELLRAKGYI
jgi:aspartate-semialdehyde dehydrogenase